MTYFVRAKTAPDRKVVNKEYPYEDGEEARKHLRLLLKQGWKADIMIRPSQEETKERIK